MDYERCLRIIDNYKVIFIDSLKPKIFDKNAFKIKRYSLWAIQELGEEILKESELVPENVFKPRTPIEIVEDFSIRMDYFAYLNNDLDSRLIFSIARDTVDEIGSLLVKEMEDEPDIFKC